MLTQTPEHYHFPNGIKKLEEISNNWEQKIHPSYQIVQSILKVIKNNNSSIKEKLKITPVEGVNHCLELLEMNENLLGGILK